MTSREYREKVYTLANKSVNQQTGVVSAVLVKINSRKVRRTTVYFDPKEMAWWNGKKFLTGRIEMVHEDHYE